MPRKCLHVCLAQCLNGMPSTKINHLQRSIMAPQMLDSKACDTVYALQMKHDFIWKLREMQSDEFS